MGYPMSYTRVVKRGRLDGTYQYPLDWDTFESVRHFIAGDLRRLEHDQRDDYHLRRYARYAGCTPEQAKAVLDAFFDDAIMYSDAPEKAARERDDGYGR